MVGSSSWLVSFILHASGFGALVLGARAGSAPPLPPARVELVLAPAPTVAPPPPEPPSSPTTAPAARRTVSQPKAQLPTRAEPPPVASPLASEPAPLDLTGTTMVSEHGGFAAPVGNGGFGSAPAPSNARTAPAVALAPSGPTLARHEDLARLPSPPDLGDRLSSVYPQKERALGRSGQATLSLIVDDRGRVTGIVVRQATTDDFGAACKETVSGSQWTPPLDKAGKPVATRVSYTCRFDVR